MISNESFKAAAREKIKNNCLVNPNGCWIWQKYLDKDGYGIVRFMGKLYRVSRLSLWAFGDFNLYDLKYSLHTCNNRACGNPEHLYKGSQYKNMQDRKAAGKYEGIYRAGPTRFLRGDK